MSEKNEAVEANQKMDEWFKVDSVRESSLANSEAEWANDKIQEEFNKKTEGDNLLPFHIDINNPPIKK